MSFKTYGVLIDGKHTDIVIGNFVDNLFIALTQYKRIGCFVHVVKETFLSVDGQQDIYDVRTLLGEEEGPGHIAARFLAEEIKIPKSTVFSINLKDNSLQTLKQISEVLLQIRNW